MQPFIPIESVVGLEQRSAYLPSNREPHNRVDEQLSVWSDHAGRDVGGVRKLQAGRAANSKPASALMNDHVHVDV